MATMSSMGYGDGPRAFSDVEYLYSILAQVLGACLAAAIFSNIAQLINKNDDTTMRYQDGLNKVYEFSRLYKLAPKVKRKLLGYHELLFAVNRGHDIPAITSMFPLSVQEEVFADLHERALRRVPMFHLPDCDDSFFRNLVRHLQVNVLLDGDFIFRQNEVGDRMYFIKTGFIQVGTPDKQVIFASKGPGSFFGEFTLFSNSFRRNGSAWALSDCIIFSLINTDFLQVLRRFDNNERELYEKMRSIAYSQRKNQRSSNANRVVTTAVDDMADTPASFSSSLSKKVLRCAKSLTTRKASVAPADGGDRRTSLTASAVKEHDDNMRARRNSVDILGGLRLRRCSDRRSTGSGGDVRRSSVSETGRRSSVNGGVRRISLDPIDDVEAYVNTGSHNRVGGSCSDCSPMAAAAIAASEHRTESPASPHTSLASDCSKESQSCSAERARAEAAAAAAALMAPTSNAPAWVPKPLEVEQTEGDPYALLEPRAAESP